MSLGSALSSADTEARSVVYDLDIPAENLNDALQALALASRHKLFYQADLASGKTNPALKGQYTVEEAVKAILSNTDLGYEIAADGTVFIRAKGAATAANRAETNGNTHDTIEETGKNSSQDFRVAQVDQGSPSKPSSLESTSAQTNAPALQEVVVTATKREERLIDVPQAMSVLSSAYLSNLNAVQFRDFANTIPGLNFNTLGAGYTQISLRGVTSGADVSPTVGIYINDVPYGSSTTFAQGRNFALDVGLFDLDRIEVLRGPQGTLYGASTMGGLIKYVTKRPDTKQFGVDLATGLSDTSSGGVNANGSVTINAPIVEDKAALRVSGFYSRDGGWIDNIALGRRDVNRSDVYGGRADALVTPTSALTIVVSGFLQNISRNGEGTADYRSSGTPVSGVFEQSRGLPEPFDQQFRLASTSITYDFSAASLVSISSYQSVDTHVAFDASSLYVPLFRTLNRNYSAVGLPYFVNTDKFTQELRLASKKTRHFEWLVGGFYTHEKSGQESEFQPWTLAGQPAPNDLFTISIPSRYDEYAVFGDATFHLSERLDVSGGARYAEDRQRFEQIGSGLFGRSTPARNSNENVSTYLGSLRYRYSDRITTYARYATGYRPGGPNFVTINAATGQPVGPPTFEADRLKSYELGFKAESAEKRYAIDVAVYYIDWDNIQVSVSRGGFSGRENAPGGATVRGAELSLSAMPIERFTLSTAAAYQNAALSEANSDLGATRGERLPNVARFTGTLNADYALRVAGFESTLGSTVRYVGDRTASFNASVSNPQFYLPSYTSVDLRAGLAVSLSVELQIYVRNLFNEKAQLSAFTSLGPPRVAVMQPRTIGISASTHF